ncbi:MFS transporter [Kineosporia sp. J2-2]|uniref:MFS transporter n=1 Tax=Kineosporia corallincola TaxID=2835133 RepID=A0ABS5TMQ9_9ACTN|nr:MFS transporter [Kineosporia corallincola]MBT0772365.1 MFS transporter [Kineosporia corallincola]
MVGTDRIGTTLRTWFGELVPARGPARRLAVLTIVQSTGYGLFLTSSAIFFRETIGLSTTQVGLGLSIAGLAGLLLTVPIGRLADRFGARRPLFALYAALIVLFTAYCGVTNFAGFVLVASLISICETSVTPLRATLTHELFPPEDRVRVSAQMRSLLNVGFMAGAAGAGAALAVGTRSAFIAVVLLSALGHAFCAVIVWRLEPGPVREPVAPHPHQNRSGLRDLRFVGLALLAGVLEFYQPILTVALPLWIVTRTDAPNSVNAVILMLDTVLVILLQVAASRGAETVPGAARMLRRSGLVLALSCAVFATTQGASAAVAIPVLLIGTVVLVVGELSQAAGSWGLALHLPPPGKQGEYQGVFALGRGLQQTTGPAVVTFLAVSQGWWGWLVLGVLLAAAGLACPPLTRSAQAALAGAAPLPPTPSPAGAGGTAPETGV